ncbi:unnamed protein product [Caenorhabditis angaria]|uniref:ADP/ATP translocase n=1 Tax=Caenorhabditis angaria TaxID=860376 RepID=A0A9P1IVS3_9PELO|nr:unnamed protein product [Caenorhabditis angaria]
MSVYTAAPGISKHDALKFSKDFMAGATAAMISKTVIAPVERVKLILQLQTAQTTLAQENRYKGMVDCFLRVPKEQGFFSFWRGNWVNILRSCSQESLGLSFKEVFRKYTLNEIDPKTNPSRFLVGNLVAGGAAGGATLGTIYPLDFIRTRLAVDLGKNKADREFTGMFDCARKIIKADGIRGLYKGLIVSLQYMCIYRASYYGLFDTAVPYMALDGKKLSFTGAFLVGQVVTLIAAMTSYPLDTVRRRLMMGAGKKKLPYTTMIACMRYIYVNEGPRAFFHGALVNAIRGTGAALVLAIYNELQKNPIFLRVK